MGMGVYLSEGALKRMSRDNFSPEKEKEVLKPVLQVIDLKPNSNQYRFLLSDGTHHMYAALTRPNNHLLDSGRLQKGSVVMLTHFSLSKILCVNLKYIIVHDLYIMVEKVDLIGEPVPAPNTLTWPFDQGVTSANSHADADAITASIKDLSLDHPTPDPLWKP